MVFEQVCSDLENEGYEVQPFLLSAAGVGATHRRDRFWFVAHAGSNGHELRGFGENRSEKETGKAIEEEWEWFWNDVGGNDKQRIDTDTNVSGWQKRRPKWKSPIQFTQDYQLTSEPGICRGNDGFPYRVDRLKSLGNAIQPQVALQIFKAIEQYETQ